MTHSVLLAWIIIASMTPYDFCCSTRSGNKIKIIYRTVPQRQYDYTTYKLSNDKLKMRRWHKISRWQHNPNEISITTAVAYYFIANLRDLFSIILYICKLNDIILITFTNYKVTRQIKATHIFKRVSIETNEIIFVI